MSRFFANLSPLHWGLLILSIAMLTYALSQPAREAEPALVPGSSAPAARPVTRQPVVQPVPGELHKQVEHESRKNDLRYQGNLDDENTEVITELIFNIATKYQKSLCLVTHDADLAKRCDRIMTIENGTVV